MILSVGSQASLFLATVAIGAVVCSIYDCLRVFRIILRHANAAVQIEDLLYWITVTLIIFAFMMGQTFGEIRAFSVLGILTGMLLYYLTLSKYTVKGLTAAVRFIIKILSFIIGAVTYPFKLAYMYMLKPLLKVSARIKNKALPPARRGGGKARAAKGA